MTGGAVLALVMLASAACLPAVAADCPKAADQTLKIDAATLCIVFADAETAPRKVLVHEMVHLGLPELGRMHDWLAEGLATYVEGVARAQAGNRDISESGPKIAAPCHWACRAAARAAWTKRAPGRAPTGAGRCSACRPTSHCASKPRTA